MDSELNAFIRRQRAWSGLFWLACIGSAAIALGLLAALVATMLYQGLGALDPRILFFTTPEGGMQNGLVGSVVIVGLATVAGVPMGLLCGIWLTEVDRGSRFGRLVRLCLDVLAGVPSIVIGILVYVLVVDDLGYSGWAAAMALGLIMVPVVARTAEEMLRMVPDSFREAAYGLGARRSQVVASVVLPAARSGLITGGLLAIARVAGETAPLLFTAGGSSLTLLDPREPMSALPLEIYAAATEPSVERIQQGWAGMLLLVLLVLALNIVARLFFQRRSSS